MVLSEETPLAQIVMPELLLSAKGMAKGFMRLGMLCERYTGCNKKPRNVHSLSFLRMGDAFIKCFSPTLFLNRLRSVLQLQSA